MPRYYIFISGDDEYMSTEMDLTESEYSIIDKVFKSLKKNSEKNDSIRTIEFGITNDEDKVRKHSYLQQNNDIKFQRYSGSRFKNTRNINIVIRNECLRKKLK